VAAVPDDKAFRVLSLDGGGMRGTYTATYLDRLASTFAQRRGIDRLDLGRGFDLIVGSSTGAIIACAVAVGVPLSDVVDLYRKHGQAIFPRRLPSGILELVWDLRARPGALTAGDLALREALTATLGGTTIGALYRDRKIALTITAVELSQHRSWVFKTPHLKATNHRDDHYRLVDVCMASTAAPIYRSLAAIEHPDKPGSAGYNVFADGGLWANNPVLVGLIEALEMTERGRQIEAFSLGTCPYPAGEQIPRSDVNRGLREWKFGGMAAGLSIDAQEFAYDKMARMLSKHLDRSCEVLRFPREQIPAALMPYLELDDTRAEAISALINQARCDADKANSRCGDPADREGRIICGLFADMPAWNRPTVEAQLQ
jgi:hypothetical protein